MGAKLSGRLSVVGNNRRKGRVSEEREREREGMSE